MLLPALPGLAHSCKLRTTSVVCYLAASYNLFTLHILYCRSYWGGGGASLVRAFFIVVTEHDFIVPDTLNSLDLHLRRRVAFRGLWAFRGRCLIIQHSIATVANLLSLPFAWFATCAPVVSVPFFSVRGSPPRVAVVWDVCLHIALASRAVVYSS